MLETSRRTSIRSTLLRGCPALLAASFVLLLAGAGPAWGRDLSFEDRVRAQAAIERVYHSHLTGSAKRPFEQVVTRAVLEAKVRNYLKESAALEKQWGTPVTPEMLRKEMLRIAAQSRMPDRLLELYAALGNDPFLVQECLARPILVQRMTHGFFAFDQTLHREERKEAEEIQKGLTGGWIDPRVPRQGRNEIHLARAAADRERGAEGADLGENPSPDPTRLDVSDADFSRWDARLPAEPGGVGPVLENRDAFVVHVLLDTDESSRHVANYVVHKTAWDDWWVRAAARFDERAVSAVAATDARLPIPTGNGSVWSPDSMTTTSTATPASVVAQAPADDTWNNGSLDALPDPRYRHSAVWTGSEMIVWGGFNNGSYLNSGGRYDPATDSWRAMTTIQAPTGRSFHVSVWTGSVMFVWGGYSPRLVLSSSFSCTITETNTMGVCTDTYSFKSANALPINPIDTGGIYDPATDTWQPTPMVNTNDPSGLSKAPTPRYGATAVFMDPFIVIWGGFGVFRLTGCGLPYDSFNGAGAEDRLKYLDDGGMFIMSGGSGNWSAAFGLLPFDDFPITDSTGQVVVQDRPANVPTGRWQHVAVGFTQFDPNFGGDTPRMLIWGGFGYPAYATDSCGRRIPSTTVGSLPAYLNTGAIYDIFNDAWTPLPTAGAPLGRTFATGVWTGDKLVVWGGYNGSGAQSLNSGGLYDPAGNSWSAASTTNAPVPRYQHSAVWTGSRMIVWGGLTTVTDLLGVSHTVPFGDGASYDPVADRWSAISSSNAPLPRFGHSAIWTGSLMIVWGGDGAPPGRAFLSALDTGGRYDPVSDSWTPTQTTGAPEPRSGHAAVWTGSEMLVWGGADHISSIYYVTGGRYDPATDSWTATSIVNAPPGRTGHTAVWTGSQMLVWGGSSITGFDAFLNPSEVFYQSGGRYDPLTDAWTAISTTNAPGPRRNHTAVWTGSRMVVWGGDLTTVASDGTTTPKYLNTGGRYDPLTDTWTATTPANAPKVRTGHTAVWTGSQMLVWGGFSPSASEPVSYLNTGYAYDPAADTWSSITNVCSNDSTLTCTTNTDCGAFGNTCLTKTGVPDGRYKHTAIWTGTQMIVWGGFGNGLQEINQELCCFGLFTGALYDPSTGTWTPTSTNGAPVITIYDPTTFPFGRLGHSAVWTGSQMIVWGGTRREGQEYSNNGGRYDPATDSWTATSMIDAPSMRSNHTAVWTGEEMLIFGGGTNGGEMQSGGRYAAASGTLATYYLDSDGDGTGSASLAVQAYSQPAGYVANTLDCNDADPGVWATPSEVRNVLLRDRSTLIWDPPSAPGATSDLYDALRSGRASDFVTSAVCLQSDGPGLSVADAAVPAPGTAFFYLVRAQDGCPGTAGTGSLGTDSSGLQRTGRACP